jgi:hypothetical protein
MLATSETTTQRTRSEKAMMSNICKRGVLPVLSLAFALGAASGAMAQSATPSANSEVQGATSGLGSSHRFATAAAASANCPGDTIVWSSGSALTYSLSTESSGKTAHGFYACKAEADSAGFHAAP